MRGRCQRATGRYALDRSVSQIAGSGLSNASGPLKVDAVIVGGGSPDASLPTRLPRRASKSRCSKPKRMGAERVGASFGWISGRPPAPVSARSRELSGVARPVTPGRPGGGRPSTFIALIRRLDIKCDLGSRPRRCSSRPHAEQSRPAARANRRRGATPVSTLRQCPRRPGDRDAAGFPALAALREPRRRHHRSVSRHTRPRRRGGRTRRQIFERSPVARSGSPAKTPTSFTIRRMSVTTRRVVVATGHADADALRSRWRGTSGSTTSYFALTEPVPAKIRASLGSRDHVLRDSASIAAARRAMGGRRAAACRAAPTEPPAHALAREDARAAHRQLMYELSTMYPDISGLQAGLRVGRAVRADRRRPAVHRSASQLSASTVRVRRLEPQRDRRVSRQPHPAAPSPRRARAGRRRFGFAVSGSRLIDAPLDLLVFGPHPDDLEIGLGGTIARHAAAGRSRRAVRSHGRRDGQQRNASTSGWPKPRRRARVLGAAWRENLRWPDRAHRHGSGAPRRRPSRFIRRHRPRVVAVPYWSDRHPDHVAASAAADRSGLQRRPAAVSAPKATRGRPSGSATTSSTIGARRRSSSTCRDHYETEAPRARLPREPVPAAGAGRRRDTRLNTPLFRQLIESRDAQFGALAGVPLGRRLRRARAAVVRSTLLGPDDGMLP